MEIPLFKYCNAQKRITNTYLYERLFNWKK
jgi:hypothetical protein